MSEQLETFRNAFLGANTWAQRKDGIPLYLLDQLSDEELLVAEKELIDRIQLEDTWPIIGLGYIGSSKALPKLYKLVEKSRQLVRITLAHAIFKINQDPAMKELVLQETGAIENWSQLIEVIYMLADFKDERCQQLLQQLAEHPDFLVSYHAKKILKQT